MPCSCDYMEPGIREIESRRVAQLLMFVLPKLELPVAKEIVATSKNEYGDMALVDKHTALLCHTIESMTPEQKEAIVYDAHDSMSRSLADWWDIHQEHDKIRKEEISKKEKQAKHNALFKQFKGLTTEQMEHALAAIYGLPA